MSEAQKPGIGVPTVCSLDNRKGQEHVTLFVLPGNTQYLSYVLLACPQALSGPRRLLWFQLVFQISFDAFHCS